MHTFNRPMIRHFIAAVTALLSLTPLPVTHSQTASHQAASHAASSANAPGVKTDRRVYVEPPPPALPAAGGTFVDPVFGTNIIRVTDERDGKSNETPYSYWPSFNKDSTRLYVKSDDQSLLFGFDPDNFGVTTKRKLFQHPLPEGGYPWADDVIWSGTDPNTVYCHQGLRVYSYNVVMNNYELIHDFAGQVPGDLIWQMSKSLDDDTFGFHLKNTRDNYKVVGYAAWQRRTNALYAINEPGVNEVQVDKTGRYLVVTMELPDPPPPPPDSGIEVRVVDLQTKQITDLKDGGPDFAPGHHDCGRGTVVGADNWNNSYTFRQLANPHKFVQAVNFGNDWSLSGHVSLLADDESWALVSTFVANKLTNLGVFKNELFLVATDGSGRVRRLAHHNSVYRDYADTPRANISRDGHFAAFTSNWGSTSRRDVFVVEIPPTPGTEKYDAAAHRPKMVSSVPHPTTPNPTPHQTAPSVATSTPPPATTAAPATATTTPAASTASVTTPPTTIMASSGEGTAAPSRNDAQPVTWTVKLNCAVTGDSLQKTAGSDRLADAEARSEQAIRDGSGYVEFTVADADKTLMVGLTHNPAALNFASVDFGIKLTADGVAEARENNTLVGKTPYAAGDTFRIAVTNRQVIYYKNGKSFYTSANQPNDALVAKAVIAHLGARVSNAVISTH